MNGNERPTSAFGTMARQRRLDRSNQSSLYELCL